MASYKNILTGVARTTKPVPVTVTIQPTIETYDDQISKLLEDMKKKHAKKPEIGEINAKMEEAKKMAEQSSQMRKEIIELKAKLEAMQKAEKKLSFDSHNQMSEYKGQLPENTQFLYSHAVDLLKGEWGPSNYTKSIEIFEKLLIDPEYQECAAFYLAGIYLKGKVDNLRKDRQDRRYHLSDLKKAELYAKLIKSSAWKTAWDKKKQKYLLRN
jgi:hypothetical protein